MILATRPDNASRDSDPIVRTRLRQRIAALLEGAIDTCSMVQHHVTAAGGLASVQAVLSASDVTDLVAAFEAARTLALVLDPSVVIADLT